MEYSELYHKFTTVINDVGKLSGAGMLIYGIFEKDFAFIAGGLGVYNISQSAFQHSQTASRSEVHALEERIKLLEAERNFGKQ